MRSADADGACCGVLETVVSIDEADAADDTVDG